MAAQKYLIEIEDKETQTAITEMLSTFKPKGVIKMMELYKKDFTIRTVVNKKLGIR